MTVRELVADLQKRDQDLEVSIAYQTTKGAQVVEHQMRLYRIHTLSWMAGNVALSPSEVVLVGDYKR